MNIIQVKLISYPEESELIAKIAGLICYSGENVFEEIKEIAALKPDEYLAAIIKSGHLSIIEHNVFVFYVSGISRSCSHQLVRKRIASFSQQSQRYVNAENFEYIIPDEIYKSSFGEKYKKIVNQSHELYQEMVKNGIQKEDARYILPNATSTQLIVSMNGHSLIDLLVRRLCCYDDQTEVLTKNGWKRFENINDKDIFYSLNLNTNENQFVKPINFFKEKHYGDMIRIKSQSIDLLITPNHNNVVSYSYDNKKFVLDEAKNYLKHKRILMKKNCKPIRGKKSDFVIIKGASYRVRNQFSSWKRILKDRRVPTKEFFLFLGMFIADGHAFRSNYHYVVGISNKNKKLIDKYTKILRCLTNNKIQTIKDKGGWRIEVHDRTLYNFFKKLGKAKFKHIPKFLWDYDFSLLEFIYEGLYDGDMTKRETGISHSTISSQLADDIQILMLHLGHSATISMYDRIGTFSRTTNESGELLLIPTKNIEYRISINKAKNEPIIKSANRDAFSINQFQGDVFCVELEKNNTLYVRRNGRTAWSGNSRSQWEIRELAERMLEEVKKVAPTIFKNLGAFCDFYGYCPENSHSCGKAPTIDELKEKADLK
ncbi:MAG: FAD-dependent thymidylate synthase [Candidatus Heimdallarchaeaceae archaeon]